FPECAQALSKYRINPGNMGGGKRRDDNFAQMIEVAARNAKPVRIGVNWGSLDHELLARMMDENAKRDRPGPPRRSCGKRWLCLPSAMQCGPKSSDCLATPSCFHAKSVMYKI